jgi:hypothetical protein
MGANPLPDTAGTLREWLENHPAVGQSPAGEEAIAFLSRTPLRQPTRFAYRMLHAGAVSIIPQSLLQAVGIKSRRGGRLAGRMTTNLMHSALGFSPAWAAAIERSGASRPKGLRFRAAEGVTR